VNDCLVSYKPPFTTFMLRSVAEKQAIVTREIGHPAVAAGPLETGFPGTQPQELTADSRALRL
jgi:hypothetical protein